MYEWIKNNPQFSTNAFNEIVGKILEHHCAQIWVIRLKDLRFVI